MSYPPDIVQTMTDQKKTVNVKTARNWESGVDHEGASGIWVTDGHLHVGRIGSAGEKQADAIYAPNQWISAAVIK